MLAPSPCKFIARLCVLFILAWSQAAVAQTVVRYPRSLTGDDGRDNYPVLLLKLALSKAGPGYTVIGTPLSMLQNRVLAEIARPGGDIDIVASMTNRERESQLLAIRIPVDKGLIGWRLALVRADHAQLFRDVHNKDELMRFQAGQGHDWPDTDILRAAGLPVRAISSYDSLFGMLSAGRIDYFPRSIMEVGREAAAHPDLATDSYVAIHYPAAQYFFVNRANTQLAEAVRRGLEAAIADGSFDQLFNEHYGAAVRAARLDQRRVIELDNPALPPETPLGRRELWLGVEALRHGRAGGRPHP